MGHKWLACGKLVAISKRPGKQFNTPPARLQNDRHRLANKGNYYGVMKICCISDLHGALPRVPDCELLLLGGDYCPAITGQSKWLRDQFAPWLKRIAARGIQIGGVAGNHDFIWEKRPDLVPRLSWTYLQDSSAILCGISVYGTPWQPRFLDWAFNLDEPELAEKWKLIPNDASILLLHGPPNGAGDLTVLSECIGSPSLRRRIEEVQPRLVVCGHNHAGYGHHVIGDTLVVNASLMDDNYQPVNPPIVIEVSW